MKIKVLESRIDSHKRFQVLLKKILLPVLLKSFSPQIFFFSHFQTNTTKGNPAEVEIIRYQALIPVGEVQVKAGAVVDTDGHYTWELIQLKTSADRPREKSYHLSNR